MAPAEPASEAVPWGAGARCGTCHGGRRTMVDPAPAGSGGVGDRRDFYRRGGVWKRCAQGFAAPAGSLGGIRSAGS
ncbi:MAG: hypothetical protein ACK55I_17935, partial [bacterium]